jgi:hypothetical protein
MFAGPNGSGKSTMKGLLKPEWLGVYLNPDEIERALGVSGVLDLNAFAVTATTDEVVTFFGNHPVIHRAAQGKEAARLYVDGGKVVLCGMDVNSYVASACADFLRRKLLRAGASMSLETVMSSPDKVQLLRLARSAGYRTYLYYVATEDPPDQRLEGPLSRAEWRARRTRGQDHQSLSQVA